MIIFTGEGKVIKVSRPFQLEDLSTEHYFVFQYKQRTKDEAPHWRIREFTTGLLAHSVYFPATKLDAIQDVYKCINQYCENVGITGKDATLFALRKLVASFPVSNSIGKDFKCKCKKLRLNKYSK